MAAISVLAPLSPTASHSTLLNRFLLPARYFRSSDGDVFRGITGLRAKASRFASLVVKACGGGSFGDGGEHNNKKLDLDDGSSLLVRTLLIDNYDSYTYNIFQDLSVINGVPPVVVRNDEWAWEYLKHQLYTKKAFDNIVISPGPGSPACPEDVGICLQVLMECEDIPILGVCLGHQALGFVHGAQIVHAPEPIHGRLSEIEHTGCKLFKDIPSGRKSGFKVVRYHSLVIDHNSLPNDLIPVAWTTSLDTLSFLEVQSCDPLYYFRQSKKSPHLVNGHDLENTTRENSDMPRVLMGVKHSTHPHYGVQFHPESIATCHGRKIFKNFKEMTVDFGLRSSARPKRKLFPSRGTSEVTNGHVLFKEITNGNLLHSQNHATFFPERMDLKHLKLKWRKFEGLANQVGGSGNIFVELFGNQNGNDSFWLDSSSTDKKRARFSFMGGKGGELWKQITFRLSDQRANCGGYLTIRDANGSERSTFLKDGFLEFLNQELKSFCYAKEDYEGLPFDFCGGYVGFIGYNMKIECGALFNNQKSETPDACFFFADNLVVVDHSNGDVYILSVYDILHPVGLQGRKYWLDETEKRLLNLRTLSTKKLGKQQTRSTSSSRTNPAFVVEKSRQQYMNDVEKCLQFIHNGESYELCLTTQMRMLVKNINTLALYLDLRNQNPAPYAAWLSFSKENLSICCSSPERFLQLNQNGILEAKPIKGTITRGATICEDEHLRLQLQNSEKDQAENLMIVDLLRNDLGRVCEPGTVHVPRMMEVESYATVHTLVSTIQGKMRPSLSPVECVRAAFPGGSMTGAPKLRSMEILDSLECSSRGIYSGSIGFFSYNQTFDFNIVIRTIVIHNEEASIGAGGAVVALSNPDGEYDEMMLKARAPTKAVERHLNEQQSRDRRSLVTSD